VSLALYRRYRPETFAEVIGQEHVTEPLQQAIRNGRVNHAYLFSGPRGCGKTTSARILARALNCEQGPTPTPCGVCRSCLDLARGGGGGLDVIEIDAASHGGVDDARDLRDRAAFAPASSRYKIYIVDEAHMVTTAGFNALLKVVEEPPEHLKFIFATTEPEKVIPTIRSRTHHYPFRLVPPTVLREYLATLCEREKVSVEPAVLPLVVRAGAGSVRDSLSVLDQLMGGAGPDGLTLVRATALLGYTDSTLLDDVIDAFAAHDGAAVFTLVDRVIEGGHDPRRFVADLLDRLRDLVILAAVPEAAGTGLIDAPSDAVERMAAQAARFGQAEISRAADLVNTGLTEMRGATAPRLQLELICARVLLPGAGDTERDLHARLDRIERRLAGDAAVPVAPAPRPVAVPSPTPAAAPPPRRAPEPPAPEPAPEPTPLRVVRDEERQPPPEAPAVKVPAPEPPAAPEPAPVAPVASGATDIVTVRRMWPEILEVVKKKRRVTWMIMHDNVQVASVEGDTIALAFSDEGTRKGFLNSAHDTLLREAIGEVLRAQFRLDAVHDPSRSTPRPPAGPAHAVPPPSEPDAPGEPAAAAPTKPAQPKPAAEPPPPPPPPMDDRHPDDNAALDDAAAPDDGMSGRDLLMKEFGASVLSEVEHD
jgi:DNA polymerase-3 subunit gamma/tau